MMSRLGLLYVGSLRSVKITTLRENGHGDCLKQIYPAFFHASFKRPFTSHQVHHDPWYSSWWLPLSLHLDDPLFKTSHAQAKSTTSLEGFVVYNFDLVSMCFHCMSSAPNPLYSLVVCRFWLCSTQI